MRRLIAVLASAIICFFLLTNFHHDKPGKKITAKRINAYPLRIVEGENETKEDGIAEAQKMEFELTKDVSLGYIPKLRLIKAY
jgi:hypothetical protein